VSESVPWSVDGAHPHPIADLDDLAVTDRCAVEGDLVVGVDQVRRSRGPCQRDATGDVVVVDVGLEDMSQPNAVVPDDLQDAVDVALRVDDERHLAVVDEIAAVAERRCFDRADRHARARLSAARSVGWCGPGAVVAHQRSHLWVGCPDLVQAVVPPVTSYASKPAAIRNLVIADDRLPVAHTTYTGADLSHQRSFRSIARYPPGGIRFDSNTSPRGM